MITCSEEFSTHPRFSSLEDRDQVQLYLRAQFVGFNINAVTGLAFSFQSDRKKSCIGTKFRNKSENNTSIECLPRPWKKCVQISERLRCVTFHGNSRIQLHYFPSQSIYDRR